MRAALDNCCFSETDIIGAIASVAKPREAYALIWDVGAAEPDEEKVRTGAHSYRRTLKASNPKQLMALGKLRDVELDKDWEQLPQATLGIPVE